MITFSLVDVKNITSDVPRSEFKETDLDEIADLILECGGILKPLILKVAGAESYKVVDGHLEYYAAVRAKEKAPREGEMVNAFIITPKNEQIVAKQVQAIKDLSLASEPKKIVSDTSSLEPRLTNIELRIEQRINDLKAEQAQEREKLEDRLKQIENQLPKKITPLEAFNTLNTVELALKLTSAGITDKTSSKIAESVEEERKKKEFSSLSDVVERVKIKYKNKIQKGISSDKMIAIVDSWSRTLFV